MDSGTLVVICAGFVLVGLLIVGTGAALIWRRRLTLSIGIGLLVGLIVLPFIAWYVAWLTHHDATVIDLTAPAYIVVTASTIALLGLVGLFIGLWAESRRHGPPLPPTRQPDDELHDDPAVWLPWGERREAR